MAVFRKVHCSFWSDPFIADLNQQRKLFYLYILTNERTKQCGIYEISKKQISYDLGYSIDIVSNLIEYFSKIGKIKYNETTKELAVKNWLKFNGSTSPKVKTCIDNELKLVKDRVLIEYLNSMYTLSQEEEEEEEEREEKEEGKEKNISVSESAHALIKFIKDKCPQVAKMKYPLTLEESERLVNEYSKTDIAKLFNEMDNWGDLKKKTSANKTFRSWAQRGSVQKIIEKAEYKFQPKAISSELPQQSIQFLHDKFGLPLDWNEYEIPSRSYFIKAHQNQEIKRYFL